MHAAAADYIIPNEALSSDDEDVGRVKRGDSAFIIEPPEYEDIEKE